MIAALSEDEAAAVRAWTQLLPAFDLDALEPGSARLVPLLERNLERLELQNPWRDRMRGVARYWWSFNQLLLHAASQAIAQLEAAGIPTMVLKGAAMIDGYYGDAATRPMTDVDVLVPIERADEALSLLRRHGWRADVRADAQFRRVRHAVALRDRGGRTLDLHWAIHEDDCRVGADAAVWQTAIPAHVAGVETSAPAPASLLLNVIGHGAKSADGAIRWVADAYLIVRSGRVDWDQLVDEAVERRFVARLRACLAYLSGVLALPIPPRVIERLHAAPVGLMERLEHQVRTHRHDRFGLMPDYVFGYLRTRPEGDMLMPQGFGRYLQAAWGLASLGAVPRAVVDRAWSRLLDEASAAAPLDARVVSEIGLRSRRPTSD